MKKWKCTVCGYIHAGDAPPEKCPVCGADKSLFEAIAAPVESPAAESAPAAPQIDAPAQAAPENSAPDQIFLFGRIQIPEAIVAQSLKHHAHPVSVHIPNGLLPVTVIFALLAAIFNCPTLASVAFYNLLAVVLTLPLVIVTGYIEWQRRYGGHMTQTFKIKIGAAIVIGATALPLLLLQIVRPQAAIDGPVGLYILLHLIMLGAAGVAGLYGGKLVFKD